jgi:hypothetical protein
MRSEIGLGDLATALKELNASGDTTVDIARLLGVAAAPPPARPALPKPRPRVVDSPQHPESQPSPSQRHEDPLDDRHLPIGDRSRLVLRTTPLPSIAVSPPDWLTSQLPAAPRRSGPAAALPSIDPLLQPRLFASILIGLAQTFRRDGDIDVGATVDTIARRRPLTAVARHLQPTVRMGVELLLDRSEAMTPFEPDMEQLVVACQRVLGAGVRVRSFDERPTFAGEGAESRWTTYAPPAAGTPVIAVTDFGIARGAIGLADDWLAVSGMLRRAGCPLVALVPWPARRHPQWLKRRIPIVEWDRGTTMRSLREVARSRSRS